MSVPRTIRAPLDLRGVKTYSLKGRKSTVQVAEFARPHAAGASLKMFLASLPDLLAVKDLREVIGHVVRAHRQRRQVVAGVGSHVIKVGLNPILIDLMERGVVTSLCMNGSGIIHDFELALAGKTSEDVDASLDTGAFGMAEETGRVLNEAIAEGAARGLGLGEAVGRRLQSRDFPYRRASLLAAGVRLGIPITVHVAVGTDIIHMHPRCDGAALGQTSHTDFRILAGVVSRLEGGVYLNIGSAVILPEVFLKALAVARNLGHPVRRITTVNLDFLQQYRPLTNVVRRPTRLGGRGYALTGHHEILVPLLAAGILEALRRR